MSGVTKVQIKESPEKLQKLLLSSSNSSVKEKLQALYWLKTNKLNTDPDVLSVRI